VEVRDTVASPAPSVVAEAAERTAATPETANVARRPATAPPLASRAVATSAIADAPSATPPGSDAASEERLASTAGAEGGASPLRHPPSATAAESASPTYLVRMRTPFTVRA
jgi:DNA polymerase-3 subunit gamma/tau